MLFKSFYFQFISFHHANLFKHYAFIFANDLTCVMHKKLNVYFFKSYNALHALDVITFKVNFQQEQLQTQTWIMYQLRKLMINLICSTVCFSKVYSFHDVITGWLLDLKSSDLNVFFEFFFFGLWVQNPTLL